MQREGRFAVDDSPLREEHDSLGPVSIPQSALWGVRTARCVANLSFSGQRLGSCAPLVRHFDSCSRDGCATTSCFLAIVVQASRLHDWDEDARSIEA